MEAGHPLNAIREYSLIQIEMLSRAHSKLARQRLRDACIAARAGQAEAKAFTALLRELEQ